MCISKDMLKEAGEAGVITPDSIESLWQFLHECTRQQPGFRPAHIIYYLGGLIAISAMS